MSLRFPDNAAMDRFRSYSSFAELLNPTINRTWEGCAGHSMNERTLGEWFTFLKALYTKDNVRNHVGLFFPDTRNWDPMDVGGDHSHAFFDKHFASIPEEDLWYLYYVRYVDRTSRSSHWQLITLNQTESLRRVSAPYIGLSQNNTTVITTANNTLYQEHLTEHIARYKTFFTQHSDRIIHWDYCYVSNHLSVPTYLRKIWMRIFEYRTPTGRLSFASAVSSMSEASITLSESEEMLGLGYAANCILTRKITRTYRDPLYEVMQYSTNPCSILDWPIVEPGEHNPMLYGVELECTFDYTLKEIIDAAHTPFFIAKHDSSISGSKRNQAELVTVPMSLKALKRHYAHWFRNVDYSRFDTTKDTNNGMHVHMDRRGFDNDKHIRNMTWFYLNPANRDFLIYISERGSLEAMNRFSPIAQFPSSLSKVKAFQRSVDTARNHRGIVNFGKKATIEIRMFRGIVSFAELCKNLEFVDSVFQFTRGEKNLSQLSAADYVEWLKKTPVNRYTVLKKFIDRCKNLDDLMTACEVYDEVFNVTDPEKIKDILNRSKLQITNAHLQVLNRGKKRTFILNRETGLVDVVITNRSKLADVDRKVEDRYTRSAFSA